MKCLWDHNSFKCLYDAEFVYLETPTCRKHISTIVKNSPRNVKQIYHNLYRQLHINEILICCLNCGKKELLMISNEHVLNYSCKGCSINTKKTRLEVYNGVNT